MAAGMRTAIGVIAALWIDDSVMNRGHRKMLVNERVRMMGICAASHIESGTIVVIDYSTDIGPKDSIDPVVTAQRAFAKEPLDHLKWTDPKYCSGMKTAVTNYGYDKNT